MPSGGGVRWRNGNDGPFHLLMDARGPTGYETPQIRASWMLGAAGSRPSSAISGRRGQIPGSDAAAPQRANNGVANTARLSAGACAGS